MADQDSKVAEFCSFTGADPSVAKQFLKACSWDTGTAANRFFEFGGDVSKLAPPQNNANVNLHQPPPQQIQPQGAMSGAANAMAAALGGWFGGGQPVANHNANNGPSVHSHIPVNVAAPNSNIQSNVNSGFLSQEQQDALLAQQLMQQDQQAAPPQQDFVRAPDQVVTDRLVGPMYNQYGNSQYQQQRDAQRANFSKEWKKGPKNPRSNHLGSLFADPEYKFEGDFEAAKREGSRKNQWVLINIQDTENFTSHCLNRDVWKDKDLAPVIQNSFVFYQWTRTTDGGRRIVNLYRPTSFPCILVVDPNTGRQDYSFTVPEEPDKVVVLKDKLLEFLDDYPNPKVKPKMKQAVPGPKGIVEHMSNDDKMLQEAMMMSMADSKENMGGTDNTNHSNINMNSMDVDEHKEPEPEVAPPTPEPEEKLEDLLKPQPEKGDPDATAIRIRMPTGGVAQRMFHKDWKVEQLYIWSRLSVDGRKVSLLQTMPRLRLDDQRDKTLRELGLERATLVCSYDD